MKKTGFWIMVLFFLAGFFGFRAFAGMQASELKTNPEEYLWNFVDRAEKLTSVEFIMDLNERRNGQLSRKKALFRINYQPHRVYYRQLNPNEGVEVLYVEGANSNKAWVNPNAFPWITLHLDPHGSLMRQEHHHTIMDAGFKSIAELVKLQLTTNGESIRKKYLGNGLYKGKEVKMVKLIVTDFGYRNYTVKKGENVTSIADRFGLSDFMIKEKNPGIDSYSDIKPGDIIRLPTHYARELTLYLDPENWLPIYVKVVDDQGIFEEFTFTGIKINPSFDKDEFTTGYKEYGF
ncbi:MAG: DUF1571 domain-containing protein [Bacteroidales bacterium]